MTGYSGATGVGASWFGGSIHPNAGHWRQYLKIAGAIGRNKGDNVSELGSLPVIVALTPHVPSAKVL